MTDQVCTVVPKQNLLENTDESCHGGTDPSPCTSGESDISCTTSHNEPRPEVCETETLSAHPPRTSTESTPRTQVVIFDDDELLQALADAIGEDNVNPTLLVGARLLPGSIAAEVDVQMPI